MKLYIRKGEACTPTSPALLTTPLPSLSQLLEPPGAGPAPMAGRGEPCMPRDACWGTARAQPCEA